VPGKLSPREHERLVRLAGWIASFEKAVEVFEDFLGIAVGKVTSQRYTEEAGAAYEQLQTEEVEYLERDMPPACGGAEKMQISADGAMVPLLHGVWAEVRTLVIGDVQPAVEEKGEMVVHTRNLSYFSRKVNAQEFGRLASVEIQRRGVENAEELAAVMDGAEWEQGFVDFHCPQAIRILDFAHAAEHVNAIGESLHGEHTLQSQAWLKDRLYRLKHEGPDKLLIQLQNLQRKHLDDPILACNLAYLKKRKSQMQYPLFQAQGWPIGSGMVESGNKLVVHARLKGAGMHWAEEHVNPMLALRNILCSDRWETAWPQIETRLRTQAEQRRRHLRQQRCQAKDDRAFAAALARQNTAPPPTQPKPDASADQSPAADAAVMAKSKHRPAANHPWRHAPIGRARWQRT
jgi:hypothetical protein